MAEHDRPLELTDGDGTRMKRANQPEEKAMRKASIIEAAMRLFDNTRGGVPKVADIAAEAGVAKGTVYLYFRSREAIELAMLAGALESCFDLMDDALAEDAEIEGMLAGLVDYLAGHPTLVRLGSRYNRLMEENADFPAIVDFKRNLFLRLDRTAEGLNRKLPGLAREEGRRLMMRSFAAIVGLWQLAEPPPIVLDALEVEDIAELGMDFRTELAILLGDLWAGALGRMDGG